MDGHQKLSSITQRGVVVGHVEEIDGVFTEESWKKNLFLERIDRKVGEDFSCGIVRYFVEIAKEGEIKFPVLEEDPQDSAGICPDPGVKDHARVKSDFHPQLNHVTPSPLEGEGWDGGIFFSVVSPHSILPHKGGGGEYCLR